MKIVVVGICASGKSTLVEGLRGKGYEAYNMAQEHSCIPKLWAKKHPDKLIMLDAKLPTVQQRRSVSWTQERIDIQHARLADARKNADLYLLTDDLTITEVLTAVIRFIC
ncbi:hypothetical protein [Pectinatus cerevisiiphilus]|uniref:AAA domain-containing protein n=1 Tax=Pectinatus cerevisiiphilus TaxID=86956 RepID=A0A4R3KBI6_9FIRM|nr:hypothetical protein [Pectinatus cerevisiiphilus]TCS80418.1 hypothetical protein EDC37_10420 [Pectinatus cerevisiiphilus]